jgi:hypothetical protein
VWSAASAGAAALALGTLAAGCGGGGGDAVDGFDFAATKECLQHSGSLVVESRAGRDVPLPPGMAFTHVLRWSFPLGPAESLFDDGRIVFEESPSAARDAGRFILDYSRDEVARLGVTGLPDLRLYLRVERNVVFLWDSGLPTARTRRLLEGCLRGSA